MTMEGYGQISLPTYLSICRLTLSIPSLNMSLDKRSKQRKDICSSNTPKHISSRGRSRSRSRQKQQPIPLSPEPRQRQQHYLVQWLSKCSLQRVRSYFQAISQDDNSPTPYAAPLSSICSPCRASSVSHSRRQKVPSQQQNKNMTQSEFKAANSGANDWQDLRRRRLPGSRPSDSGQRITLCTYTGSKQEQRYHFKRSCLMNTNALWWCGKRVPTCAQGLSLWICQSRISK